MGRNRATSNASTRSGEPSTQELGSMYDYLAKIILLGPSGAGKSCLLHRFVKGEWRVLSSQTIGVEFSSKIVHIADRKAQTSHRKRIKLQLWDTAGTERFRSVSRSYYRGAAGAILVYDVSSWRSFHQLQTFLNDARALAGSDITVLLVGNKSDVVNGTSASLRPNPSALLSPSPSSESEVASPSLNINLNSSITVAEGREVPAETALKWAGENGIAAAVEVSALTGDNVEELFHRLARTIWTKIELGEIDPDDPASGIQYGDLGWDDRSGSITSGLGDEGNRYRRRGRKRLGSLSEWEHVFRIGRSSSSRRRGCCS